MTSDSGTSTLWPPGTIRDRHTNRTYCRHTGSNTRRGHMSDTSTTIDPLLSDPLTDDEHERFTHIVLEGFQPEKGDFISAGPTVVEGIVNGTAVRALCGKVWIPNRNP